MFVHEVLVPYGGLLQLGSCQLAQGFFLVPEPGIFTLDIPGLILQNLDTEGAKLILNTLLIGVFHFLTSLRAHRRRGIIKSIYMIFMFILMPRIPPWRI